jgi:hypothetical protein
MRTDELIEARGGLVVSGGAFSAPSASIGNSQIKSDDQVDAEKLEHQHRIVLAQVHGSAASAERRPVHVAIGAGQIQAVKAGCVVACTGNAAITVDVKKNGTTVLTGTITVDSGDAAYALVAGTVASAAYVAGDVLEVVVTVAAGSGVLGQGLFVVIDVFEAAD